jgi:hypothetical protein
MPQIIDLGKIRFSFKGNYSASVTYQQNDVVSYGANAYVYTSTTAASGNLPTDITRWAVLTSGLQFENAWNSETAYQVNDVVTYGGNAFVATLDGTGFVPTNQTYWSPLTSGVRGRGNWTTSTQYFPNDLVTRGGSQYSASVFHTSGATFASDSASGYWTEFVRGIRNRGTWAANTEYLKDDIVTNTVSTYIANSDFTSNAVNFDSEPTSRWTEIAQGAATLPSQLDKENYLLSTNGSAAFWSNYLDIEGNANIGGSAQINGVLHTGEAVTEWAPVAELTGAFAIFTTSASGNAYNQVAIHGEDPLSSTDLLIYNDSGIDSHGWIDIGITGSEFQQEEFGITGEDNGYIFFEAPDGTAGTGNLVIATGDKGTENAIVLAAGGFATGRDQLTIIPDSNVHVEIATESTSPSTGALTVEGGAGVQGNLNVLGNVTVQGNLQVSGGAFTTETLTSTAPIFTTGEGADENTSERGFLVEYKAPSASSSFDIGQVSASAGIGRIYRKTNSTLTVQRSSGTATIAVQEASHNIQIGETVVVSGLSNTAYNGTHTVTNRTSTTIQFVNAGEDQSPTADTSGTIAPNIPLEFEVGDIATVSNCNITVFNGDREFIRNVEANNIRFDIAASASQALVSASGTVLVNTKTRYAGLTRNAENNKWYVIDGATGTVVLRTGDSSKFTGDRRLQPPQNDINFSASTITFPNIIIGGLETAVGTLALPASNITSASVTGALNVNGSFGSTNGGSFAGTYTGTPTFSGNLTFSGNPTFSGTPIFTGGVRVQEMIEDMVDISHTSNAIECNYQNGNIFFITNTFGANFTVNLTNVPTDDGRIFTINLVVTQGATGYRPGTLNINSAGTTIRWAGATAPTPTSSSGRIDVFTFTIYRRSGSYVALGSANLNFG